MKETVIDIDDLGKIVPFFKSTFGRCIGKGLIRLLSMSKVNKIHANHCHLRGSEFTSAMLSDPLMDVTYEIHNRELLDKLPEGAFITVSNHPVGSIDGIMLIDIFASIRPDFKVMVNGFLLNIGAMGDNFISVQPDSEHRGANLKNVNGVRYSLQQLREDHPVGFFPAGAISFYNKETKVVQDLPWAPSIVRLIRKAKVPVYPVLFDFQNSSFFYWLGRVNWKIRVLRMPAEAFNKRGRKLDVYIGNPIDSEIIQSMTDDEILTNFLYQKTYEAREASSEVKK